MNARAIKSYLLLLSLLIAPVVYAIMYRLDGQQYIDAALTDVEMRHSILIIDPGHGGEDGGAVSSDGLVESGVNLDIAKRMETLCGFFGVRSIMTRESEHLDYPAELSNTAARKRWDTKRRVEIINSLENAVLLSIHQNHYPDSRPRGPQALYGAEEGSRDFAEIIHRNLTESLLPDSRRVSTPCPREVYIMSNVKCTAVLVECGFLSNPVESTLLKTSEYRNKIAAILLASYLQYTEEANEEQDNLLLYGVRQ